MSFILSVLKEGRSKLTQELQGIINSHAVTDIKWLPGSETLFLAAHNDGSLIVYDREKEDASFPEDAPDSSVYTNTANGASLMSFFGVRKSVRSSNQKTNPLSYWSVAKGAITAFAFSPDCEHIAVVSEDECLRVLNFVKEKSLPPPSQLRVYVLTKKAP